jgi:hypothetical protein
MYTRGDLEAWSNARACESTSDPVYDALRRRRTALDKSRGDKLR